MRARRFPAGQFPSRPPAKSRLSARRTNLVPPANGNGAQRAAGQFGERVMRDGFAPVEKKWNAVAPENPRQRLVIIVKAANEHGAVAETFAARGRISKFRARRKRPRLRDWDRRPVKLRSAECADVADSARAGCDQFFSRASQRRILRKRFFSGIAIERFKLISQSGRFSIRWPALLIRFADGRPE